MDAGDWLLFDADPTTVSAGRGFSPGTVHARDGSLVASFAQEVIIPAAGDWAPPATGSNP